MFKEMPKYKNLIVLSFRSSLKYNRKGILNFSFVESWYQDITSKYKVE